MDLDPHGSGTFAWIRSLENSELDPDPQHCLPLLRIQFRIHNYLVPTLVDPYYFLFGKAYAEPHNKKYEKQTRLTKIHRLNSGPFFHVPLLLDRFFEK